jgi:hypothetical protein
MSSNLFGLRSRCFVAENGNDLEALAQCFVEHAIVRYGEPFNVVHRDGKPVVTDKISGNLPIDPVTLGISWTQKARSHPYGFSNERQPGTERSPVTGGSKGIGKAVAVRLREVGARASPRPAHDLIISPRKTSSWRRTSSPLKAAEP